MNFVSITYITTEHKPHHSDNALNGNLVTMGARKWIDVDCPRLQCMKEYNLVPLNMLAFITATHVKCSS